MSLSTLLRRRVNKLDISISDLARRSGESQATVIRILGGKDEHCSVTNLQAVLSALGMKMDLFAIPAKRLEDTIASQKAQRLIALTQGELALESQSVPAAARLLSALRVGERPRCVSLGRRCRGHRATSDRRGR